MQVLHIRNLPPDATEADIMQLCKPYGRIVRVRLNAGQIKHQAFVEFESVNVAMQMIYSFVGSADPPKVADHAPMPVQHARCLCCWLVCCAVCYDTADALDGRVDCSAA